MCWCALSSCAGKPLQAHIEPCNATCCHVNSAELHALCWQAKLFKAYIEQELQLGAVERVRKLYQKFLEWAPENCAAWCKFAELERDLNEKARMYRV